MEMLFLLFVGHALGDFALQSDWMARFKNRHARQSAGSSQNPQLIWLHVLTAHCTIHAGFVYLITGSIWLGLAELIAHWALDYSKGERWIGFHTDQFGHLACKVLWWLIALATGSQGLISL